MSPPPDVNAFEYNLDDVSLRVFKLFHLPPSLLGLDSGGTWVGFDWCLFKSLLPAPAPLLCLNFTVTFLQYVSLYLDRLSVGYAVFHSICQAGWNLCPMLSGLDCHSLRIVLTFLTRVCFLYPCSY